MERESSRLKVLIHDPYPARNNSPDGVSNYIREIAPHLEDKGCSVRVVAPYIGDKENDFADYNLGRPKKVSLNNTHFDASVSFNRRRANNLIRTIKPDLIVAHEPSVPNSVHTIITAIPEEKNGRKRVPVIGQFHARVEELDRKTQLFADVLQIPRRPRFRNGLPVGFTPGLYNTIKNGLSGRIAISQATADFWNQHFPGEYKVIYNGIEVVNLTPQGPKMDSWQEDGRKTILFAGRHDERKGIEYLLRAYLNLRKSGADNIKLKLTGKGKLTGKLKSLVEREGILDVEFLGVLTREDLIKAYRSTDVFVAPSIGGEGFNRTIAEARACGALVVCTDIEGHREAIGDDLSPFMAKPADAESLAEKIKMALNLPQESADEIKVKTSVDARERFAWERIAGENVKYYDEVLVQYGKPIPEDWEENKKTIWSRIPILGAVFVNVRQGPL